MKTPEIRIYFSWLLYDNVSKDMFAKYGDGKRQLLSKEECFEWAVNYQKEWAKYETKILRALTEVTGLDFYKQTIDVACAPWLAGQSDPLIMSFYYEPDQFVDMLTHELCHVLLTDNTAYAGHSSPVWLNLVERWAKLFGKYELTTIVHIPVHALCKYIFTDILKEPSRVERDVKDCAQNEPYVKSWEYVNSHDYKEILVQLKQDYSDIQKELASR